MKKVLVLVLVAVMCVSLFAAMGAAAGEDKPGPDDKLKIGFPISTTDGFYVTKYIERYDEQIAERGYDSVMLDSKFDVATQVSQIDNLIAQDVDVIFFMANDGNAALPAMQKCDAAGIPVIAVHNKLTEDAAAFTLGFAGANITTMGEGAGQLMDEALGGEGKIVIINGTPGESYAETLKDGFMSQLSDGIEVLDTGDHGWDRSKATTVMENFLTKYDDIDGVWASDDNTAIGAINAITAAGRDGIQVVGINGQAEAWDYIKNGQMYGTVIQDAAGNVDCAFEVLDLYLNDQPIPEFTYSESPLVTKENVDTMEPAF